MVGKDSQGIAYTKGVWVEMINRVEEYSQGVLGSACMVALEGKDHSTIKIDGNHTLFRRYRNPIKNQ